tara:strand:- start:945 stop:1955 length:1011 start_codon:yes stop_codon:yes gene_type:complete
MNRMSISDTFKTVRPTLSEGSLKTYTSIIVNVGKQMDKDYSNPENILKDYEAILTHLTPLKPSIRKTKLACLIVFISKTEGNEKAINEFRKVMMLDKEEAVDEEKKQELTERQEEGWMSWDEVLERYKELEKEAVKLFKKLSLDKEEFHRLQLYILLSCLVLLPVRRSLDWVSFKLRNVNEEEDNFLTYDKRKPTLVFNDYKTKRTYGQQRLPIDTKLANILTKWTEKNPHDNLLMNYHQKGSINATQLTQLLHGFFGKPISTSLLRHIYLTHLHKGTPAIKEMAETATNMGHSIPQQLDYVKKPIVMLSRGGKLMTEDEMTPVPKKIKRPVRAKD